MISTSDAGPCPCGADRPHQSCCGPALTGRQWPETAEALMRSRYSAYVVGAMDHLFRTWHPRTRPAEIAPQPGLVWIGLTVIDSEAGEVQDETGVVEFEARYRSDGSTGVLHERSRFARRAGRWMYLDGEIRD